MAYQGSGGVGSYLQGTIGLAPPTGRSYWVSLWTAGTSTTQSGIAGLNGGAPTTSNAINSIFILPANKYGSVVVGSGSGITEPTGSAVLDGVTYQHVLYAQYSGSSFELFVNGASRVTGSAAASAATDRFLIGGSNSSNPLLASRWVAEVGFGFGLANAAAAAQIAQGVHPLSLPGLGVVGYYPLVNDGRDLGPRQMGLAYIGAAPVWRAAHPRGIQLPPRRRLYLLPTGKALTPNAATAAASQAATLARSRALSGAATATASSGASMTATHALAAAATAASTQAAALARSRALAGAATAGTDQAGSVGRVLVLAPNAATAASGQSASEAATRAMLAAATAASAQAGSVSRSRALAGATTALTTQAGSIAKFTLGELVGQGFAAGTASAALHAIRALAGAATAGAAAAGSIGRSRGLAGAGAAAVGSQAASLGRSRQLAPAGGSASSDQAGALVALHALRIAGTAAGSAQATLGRSRPLRGAANATSSQTARVTAGNLPAPAVVYNIVRFERDPRLLRFDRDLRTVRFTRADMGKPKSFKRKHPLANTWYGIGFGEAITGTPDVTAACSVANATPLDIRSVQIASADSSVVEFQAFGGDDGTLWTITATATSAVDQSQLAVDVLLPVERHFG
jgi:hypothetical protein